MRPSTLQSGHFAQKCADAERVNTTSDFPRGGRMSQSVRCVQLAAVASPLAYGALLAKFGDGVAIPSLCFAKLLLGIECPACGMSTALLNLFQGKLAVAMHLNVAVVPLAALLATTLLVARSDVVFSGPVLRLLNRTMLAAFTVQFVRQFAPGLLF